MKKYAILLFCLLTTLPIIAQRGGFNQDPETRAKKQTQLMVDSLSLSAAQAEKVDAVNLEYAKKMSDMRAEMRSGEQMDREAMRSAMQKLRAEQDEALGKYLTADQAQKWTTLQAEMRNKRGGKGRRGGKKKRNKDSGSDNSQR